MTRTLLTTTSAILFAASTAVFAADNASSNGANSGTAGQNQSQQSSQNNPQQNQQNPSNNSSAQQGQKAPQGFVLLEENTVFMMAREPQQHLLRAHEQLAANNPKAAAAELHLAGAYLKMQEARPGNQGKDVLTHWQQQLDQLAGQVGKGDVKAPELTRTAAGANYALAKYYDERARTELGDTYKQVQAGYDLQAAVDCFEQAMLWHSGAKTDQGQQPQQQQQVQQDAKAIADARLAADQLISADNLAPARTGDNAQPAAARSGASQQQSQQANTSSSSSGNGGNSAATADPKQAADELNKVINAASDKFGGQNSSSDQQKASSK